MSSLEDIDRAVAVFRSQAVALATTDLERATPCVGWDVRTLIGHVAGIYQAVSDALHGERVDLVAALASLGNEPERTLNDAATRMSHAWREPGAFDRTLPTTIRDVPAVLGARIVVGDALLHAWDLARARRRDPMPTA